MDLYEENNYKMADPQTGNFFRLIANKNQGISSLYFNEIKLFTCHMGGFFSIDELFSKNA